MNSVKKWTCVILVAVQFILSSSTICYAETDATPSSADIVLLADISGSVVDNDSPQYMKDALMLGVDLAPENSRVAVVAVNYQVVSETQLTDVSAKDGRTALKEYINQLGYHGSTDFAVGLDRAVEILEESEAQHKRVIVFGDFSEGGYNAGTRESESAAMLDSIAGRAKENGITIDMLLWKDAPAASITAPKLTALPEATGGQLYEYTSSGRLSMTVEDIYFQNFSYLHSMVSIRGDGSHTMSLPMPTDQVKRARIYASAQSPANAFSASYAGSDLDGEHNRSYSMVDLERPSREGINLTLMPGQDSAASIYLLLDYDIKIAASATNELETKDGEKEQTQVSTVQVQIVDSQTGKPLLTAPYADNVTYSVKITPPGGSAISGDDSGDPTMYTFTPEEFGAYQIEAELKVGDMTLTPAPTTINIPDIRPVTSPTNWPLIVALCIGSLLVIAALFITFRHKKRESEFQGAVEMSSDYHFHGKLYVCAVIVDGGNKEIAPYNFLLGQLGDEKRITLKQILESGNASHHFPGAEDIFFLVGPEESVIIRNNANITIRALGRDYGSNSKIQLFYDQKIYLIFGSDENELELYYRRAKEDMRPINVNITASRAH